MAASERIPRSIDNDVTGVSERSQQSSDLKDEGYIPNKFRVAARRQVNESPGA
ncbi:hypothetical protein PAU_02158 [Photorhabdus asymbiotica]|uniref:Uncharacterized protein n=1 Tax=Photorhabdus asymbiotica subsp. asymbiotica (strain ATCC 43949 / 3105-77) TaxID=553480 RepID=C7BK10_PHOAA|nr:hypothetical protein PAU_02158 [Photorhabdus asymbiotica]